MLRIKRLSHEDGFGLIELLIVVVIIGILAAIAIPVFLNQQKAAIRGAQDSDLHKIELAIRMAQTNKDNASLYAITGVAMHAGECSGATDMLQQPKTGSCWVSYFTTLDKISTASGMNIRNMVDPYGRPYIINPNELEQNATDCRSDVIGFWTDAYTGSVPGFAKNLKMSTMNCNH